MWPLLNIPSTSFMLTNFSTHLSKDKTCSFGAFHSVAESHEVHSFVVLVGAGPAITAHSQCTVKS